MDLSLIGSFCHSAEKRRASLTPHMRYRYHENSMGNGNESEQSNASSPANSSRETADQAAFRRTLGAILHDRPLDEFGSDSTRPVMLENMNHRGESTVMSVVHPGLRSDVQKNHDQDTFHFSQIAYVPSEEMKEGSITRSSTSNHDQKLTGLKRLLAFSDDNVMRDREPINPFSHNFYHVSGSSSGPNEAHMGDSVNCKLVKRKIPEKPTKVLDAPDIVDDYYLNLISWSKDNILAVAMGPSVYVWNASTGEIGHVVTLRALGDYVSSVSWSTIPGCSRYLAIGTHSNIIQLWDTEHQRCVRKLQGHSNRVSSIAWNANKNWLTTGGRDSLILQHDVRCARNIVSQYKGHRQEVCGLKWSEDGQNLASGGNENYLCIWDASMSHSRSQSLRELNAVSPRLLLDQHKAAVKALDWYPFGRGLLASGGGSADRTIKFWNTVSGTLTNSIDTGSQVCSLLWSRHQRELCSSHGFSENQLILWKYPSMTKIQELKSHTARVLNMEMSPDGRSVVSVGADETLRFWDIFGAPKNSRRGSDNSCFGGIQCPGMTTVR